MAKRKWNRILELFRLSRLRRRAPTGLAPDGLQSGLGRDVSYTAMFRCNWCGRLEEYREPFACGFGGCPLGGDL